MFCAADLLTCGLMDAARHQFLLSIPDQLCVVGFDDIEQASCSFYDLTTFVQPVVAIARQAVTWLGESPSSDRLEGHSVTLHAELAWGSSVRGG